MRSKPARIVLAICYYIGFCLGWKLMKSILGFDKKGA